MSDNPYAPPAPVVASELGPMERPPRDGPNRTILIHATPRHKTYLAVVLHRCWPVSLGMLIIFFLALCMIFFGPSHFPGEVMIGLFAALLSSPLVYLGWRIALQIATVVYHGKHKQRGLTEWRGEVSYDGIRIWVTGRWLPRRGMNETKFILLPGKAGTVATVDGTFVFDCSTQRADDLWALEQERIRFLAASRL